jgi:hypothetical protein
MFHPPRKTGVIELAGLEYSCIVRNNGLRNTKAGEILLIQGLDNSV